MERLTARDSSGHAYYPKCFEHPCEGERSCCTYTAKDCNFEGNVAERLAGYEDTGLTPDEIAILKNHVELLERERQECSECEAVDDLKVRLWDVTHKDWIPVSDGPPEPYEVILITAKMDDDEKPRTYQGAYQGSGNWKLFGVTHPDDYKIIAWMPSPEPYREG